MDVSVSSTSDAREFLQSSKSCLDLHEAGNNTILSIANQAGTPGSLLRPPFWFARSTGPNGDVGFAAFAVPDGLVLSDMQKSHCTAVVKNLLRNGIAPERIYAPEYLAYVAAEQVSSVTGRTFSLKRQWRALQIERLIDNYSCAVGDLRQANDADVEGIIQLGDQYDLENPSVVKAADYFLSRLNEGDLHFWVSENSSDILSVLALSGRTDSVIRIAGVFTPKQYRGKGYASSSIVRATNSCLLSGYSSVILVVDTMNDVAVNIYSQLGFEPIHDRLELVID